MISDWGDLQTLHAIARTGSLSAAARALGNSQSTISRRLQAIERRLDQQIFVRGGDGSLSATAAGKALIEAAERMQAAFADAMLATGRQVPPIRVATCEVVAKAVVVPLVSKWTRQGLGTADVAVHDDLFSLAEDAFDVLVTPLESAPGNMAGRRIASLEWGLFASPGYLDAHPVEPGRRDLAGLELIGASGSLAEVAACRWFGTLGGKPALLASSPSAQQEAAASGAGIALLPRAIAAGDPRLVEIAFADPPVSEVWMVARRATAARPGVAAFLKWSRGQVPERRPEGGGREPVRQAAGA